MGRILSPDNLPVVTDSSGKDYRGFRFNWADDTEVVQSCSINWEGEMYVFGGQHYMRQISKLSGCGLTSVGQLNFNFQFGACAKTLDKIFLCFDTSNGELNAKRCKMTTGGPLGTFTDIGESYYKHERTRIGASRS